MGSFLSEIFSVCSKSHGTSLPSEVHRLHSCLVLPREMDGCRPGRRNMWGPKRGKLAHHHPCKVASRPCITHFYLHCLQLMNIIDKMAWRRLEKKQDARAEEASPAQSQKARQSAYTQPLAGTTNYILDRDGKAKVWPIHATKKIDAQEREDLRPLHDIRHLLCGFKR